MFAMMLENGFQPHYQPSTLASVLTWMPSEGITNIKRTTVTFKWQLKTSMFYTAEYPNISFSLKV